ncbi:hypothetical protein, variant [Cryptococcus amylolentus CBS 6039]|uniref:Phosphatase n=1 Tax=Cryptococcus amylolentus CBS 6039 TaxID=1295533 RepID=A0A1E3HE97_9TREE|nr:hypothetical protein, variant [Cryptococcus amylolentus CBS 6039]ODN74672.1 hypothetical protein, variant [Cryptococcus amylolentus CBS 6039]
MSTATATNPDYQTKVFTADGILFDMDGTLTDSIAAVEAAWTAKAEELGLEPEDVIKATHGRRASDNLQDLVPGLRQEHIDREVEKFERSILEFADTPPRRRSSSSSSRSSHSRSASNSIFLSPLTPMTNGTPANGRAAPNNVQPLNLSDLEPKTGASQLEEDVFEDELDEAVDMSVRILPGVSELIKSLPGDKYAVATSGAKTYCHGCLERTGSVFISCWKSL